MKPVLIITRPEPDGARFAAAVKRAVPIEVILSPLLEIVPVDAACQADEVIFTSTNGVAQAVRLGLNGCRAWCVGDRTAQIAGEAGFSAISAQGTVEDLIMLVLAEAPRGPLAHIRGRETSGDLGPRLRAKGMDCVDVIAYEQRPLLLSPAAKELIIGVKPCIIPLFSPRTASLLIESVEIGGNVKVFAMSNAVAAKLGDAEVVSEPTGAAMLAAVIGYIRGVS